MRSRRSHAFALGACLLIVAVITACETGTAEECAGQVTTTTLVDCTWTTSTTTDPSTSSSTTDSSVTTSTVVTTTTTAPTTTSTIASTTTTTRPPGDLEHPWWAYKGNLAGPKVLVVGDSITALSTPAINAALYPTYATQVIGLSGSKLGAAAYYLEPYPVTDPAVVMIEFGTNDATGILNDTSGAKRATWKATYLDYKAMFPNACFVPVTMPANRNWATWDASNLELNTWLLANFPNAVDWHSFELGQRTAGYSLLGADLIHPEGLGFSAYAAVLQGAVSRCLG